MSTNKPQVKAYISNENYIKIKYIAEKDKRSISNLLEKIIEEKIEKYEKENGEIK